MPSRIDPSLAYPPQLTARRSRVGGVPLQTEVGAPADSVRSGEARLQGPEIEIRDGRSDRDLKGHRHLGEHFPGQPVQMER